MWVINLKHIGASDVMKDLRLLTSSYGELSALGKTNQLIITDWSSNMQRIAELINQIDKPTPAGVEKFAAASKKNAMVNSATNNMEKMSSKKEMKMMHKNKMSDADTDEAAETAEK